MLLGWPSRTGVAGLVGMRLQEWLGFRLEQTKDAPSMESGYSVSIRKVRPGVGPVWEALPGWVLSETGPRTPKHNVQAEREGAERRFTGQESEGPALVLALPHLNPWTRRQSPPCTSKSNLPLNVKM